LRPTTALCPKRFEAINHAKPRPCKRSWVAANKIDLPGEPRSLKQQLQEHGLTPEMGERNIIFLLGNQGTGIDQLLEMMTLQARS